MRLTQQTNYAIRVLMYCASNNPCLSRISDIAKSYSISESFAFKILKPLVDNGFIKSIRGRNGGIVLAKSAEMITLHEIISVTEENFSMAECFESEDVSCPLVSNCALNVVLHEALDAFFDVLKKYTIADLVKNQPKINFLLGISSSYDLSPHI